MKNENESEKPQSTQQEQILSLGSTLTDGAGRGIRAVTVIGQIEGHSLLPESQKSTKYEHLIPLLVQAEEDEASSGVLIILDAVGGGVEAGLALSELIAGMKTPTVSLVLGGGHSIGVPLRCPPSAPSSCPPPP